MLRNFNQHFLLKHKVWLGLWLGILLMAILLSRPSKAYALTENSTGIPQFVQDIIVPLPDCGHNYAQWDWISDFNDTASTTVTITQGQDAVALKFAATTAVCNNNTSSGNIITKDKFVTRERVLSATTSHGAIGGLINGYLDELYLPMYASNLRYTKDWDPPSNGNQAESIGFFLTGLRDLSVGSHTIHIEATARRIHQAVSGFQCIEGPAIAASSLDDLRCNTNHTSADITVIVNPPPSTSNYNLLYSATCSVAPGINQSSIIYHVHNDGPDAATGVLINTNAIFGSTPHPNAYNPIPDLASGATWDSPVITGTLNLGEKITWRIEGQPGKMVNGAGSLNDSGGGFQDCSGSTLTASPYFRAYGADVIAGAGIATGGSATCAPVASPADITAVTNLSAGYAGAGSQFAVSATGTIKNFLSSAMHSGSSSNAKPPNGLAFGNYNSSGFVSFGAAGNDGGSRSSCLPDYYSHFSASPSPYVKEIVDLPAATSPDTNANSFNWANYFSNNTDNPVMARFRDGDLTITGDITANMSVPWHSTKDIPQLYIVVKGDIYINANVKQIDAILIAQPKDDGTGGIINTCAAGASPDFPRADCKSTLTINGAFISKRVYLNRLNGDVARANPNEVATPGGAPNGNIAEIFNFSPELWIANASDISATNLRSTGRYDSIVGLPPIL